MILDGKYKVIIKENGQVVNTIETHNLIVETGFEHIVDWLKFNTYGTGKYPCIKQIDTTGMTISTAGFTNQGNAVDGSTSSYTYATVNNTSWDNVWWRIDFGTTKYVIAMYVDFMETDVDYGADYKFQYSQDGSAWTDFATRFRPPQEASTRGKVLFFTNDVPPFTAPPSGRYIRLNTKKNTNGTDQTFYVYEIKFFEDNFLPQPPLVMKLGTGSATPSGSNTDLETPSITKTMLNVTSPSGHVVRYIMSLDTSEGNDTTFTEAGLFYCPYNYLLQTTSNATSLFSRALFDTGWSKTSAQTADVYYEITVSNP